MHGIDLYLYSNGDSRLIAHSDIGVTGVPGGGRYNSAHHLQIDANQDIFIVYINGVKLLQVQDDSLENGRVGFGYEYSGDVWFDNFDIYELP